MLSIFGIIQDLINITPICSFEKNNLRPPLLEVAGDLDKLILRLRIGAGPDTILLDLLRQKNLYPHSTPHELADI